MCFLCVLDVGLFPHKCRMLRALHSSATTRCRATSAKNDNSRRCRCHACEAAAGVLTGAHTAHAGPRVLRWSPVGHCIERWPSSMARRTKFGSRHRWVPARAAPEVKSFFDADCTETEQETDQHPRTVPIVPQSGTCARDLLPDWPRAGREAASGLHSGQSARSHGRASW